MINEKSRTIDLEGDVWVLGAVWSSADYDRRPGNPYKFTREQGFDPDRTLIAHLPDTSQVGWYEFESQDERPRRAGCLVQRLLDQVARRPREEFPLPAVVILNLGECAWMAVLDQSGKILSEFERWGDMASLRAYLQKPDIAGTINAFRSNRSNDKIIDDADEALAWLFEGYRGKPLYAERLYAASYNIKIAVIAAAVFMVAGGGLYKYHQRQVAKQLAAEQAQEWLEHSKYLAQLAANTAAAKRQSEEFNQQLQDYWTNYPRPWVGAVSPAAAASACESYVTSRPQNVQGWERVTATCSFNGPAMTVSQSWKRGDLATVLAMPNGAVPDNTGNVANDGMTIQLPQQAGTESPSTHLPDVSDVNSAWIAAGQANPDTFVVKNTGFTPFKPPVPGFINQSKVQQVEAETPVIWMQSSIDLQAGMAPSDGWPDMSEEAFAVQNITISYRDNGILWQMTGVQYAQ